MSWWIPALSFAGALLGAGIPAWSARKARRQEARVEWRSRLDQAIGLVTSESEEEQLIGDELLADLINSDLGSDSDRALASRVAEIRVRGEVDPPDSVDAFGSVSDTGTEEER